MTSNMKVLSAVLGCISLLALQACSSTGEELSAEGTLRVLPIEVKTEADVEPLSTRAVDEALQVDIMQGSTVIRTYDAGSSELNGLISLPVGNYTLYAHSPQMQEAANDEQGSPTYTVSRDFKIVADMTTTLGNLEATQSNVGVLLQYQERHHFRHGESRFDLFPCACQWHSAIHFRGNQSGWRDVSLSRQDYLCHRGQECVCACQLGLMKWAKSAL